MPKIVHRETVCCGFKKCPDVVVYEDGTVEITDNDEETGSVGTIKLSAEQAERVASLITKRSS